MNTLNLKLLSLIFAASCLSAPEGRSLSDPGKRESLIAGNPSVLTADSIDRLIREMELIPIEVNGDKNNRINIVIINRWEARDQNPYNQPERRDEFVEDVRNSLLAAFTPGHPDAQTAYANYHRFFNLYALWWPAAPEWKAGGMTTELADAIRDRLFLPWKNPHTGWVTFLIMPNRSGGGGGAARNLERRTGNAVIVGNAIGKMLHEISHTCSSIGDEYTAGATGTDAVPVYNTTMETRRDRIPWRAWIDPSTPVPTPYRSEYKDKVGIFEGSQYHLTHYYRSSAQGCIMGAGVFDNTEKMCVVCEQRLSMRVYTLVDPIENALPGDTQLVYNQVTKQKFSVNRVHPEPDTQTSQWILNGKVIAAGTDQVEVEFDPGTSYELVFTLRDTTRFIREDPPFGEFPYREHRWIINGSKGTDGARYAYVPTAARPASQPGKRYEAEQAPYSGQVTMANYGGASRQSFLKLGPGSGTVDLDVTSAEAGCYDLQLVYASGRRGAASLQLAVNEQKIDTRVHFPETRPLFTGWADVIVPVILQKGDNRIRLTFADTCMVHLDYLFLPDQPDRNATARTRAFNPGRVKSAGLLLWLDASDLDGNGLPDEPAPDRGAYEGWRDKATGLKGPFIKYEPRALNGLGTAGFEMVWVSNLEKPVKGFQTLIMVYRESSMSLPGTAPFKGLNGMIDLTRYTPDRDYHLLIKEFDAPQSIELRTTEGNWEGSLAEFILYDGILDPKERKALESALKMQWLK